MYSAITLYVFKPENFESDRIMADNVGSDSDQKIPNWIGSDFF